MGSGYVIETEQNKTISTIETTLSRIIPHTIRITHIDELDKEIEEKKKKD